MITELDIFKERKLSTEEFRELIMRVQHILEDSETSFRGDALEKHCPLKHSFGDGIYVREIFMPKGTLVISKLHKTTHPYFVLEGSLSVMTEEGVVLIEAPYQGMTEMGTKRALYVHQDTVWITVHATNKRDLKEIEDEIIAKDYEEFDSFKEEQSCRLQS